MSQPDSSVDMIDRHLSHLFEHFDNVQIFASRVDEKGRTVTITRGIGNFCARRGQVRDWMLAYDELERDQMRGPNG